MSLSKILSIGLAVGLVHGTPVPDAPSRVVRRDPPKPSSYPSELGEACGNEWQYLNFDPGNDNDKANLQKMHDAICTGELRAISSWGQESASNANVVYLRYFPPKDDEDDFPAQVADVLSKIAGSSDTDGEIGDLVGSFVIDNLDFGLNDANKDQNVQNCNDPDTLAYTDTDHLDNREKIHFCPPSWKLALAANIDCSALDPFPSWKMDSFSRIALHEMTHYSSVGPPSKLDAQITDRQNEDGIAAYDPDRAHGLVDPKQDDDPVAASVNADNYAWMSTDAWVSMFCGRKAGNDDDTAFFKEPIPNYEKGDDSEPDE